MTRIDFYKSLSNNSKDNLLLLTLYNHDMDKLYELIKDNQLFSNIIYERTEIEILHDNIISLNLEFKNKDDLNIIGEKENGWITKIEGNKISIIFNK